MIKLDRYAEPVPPTGAIDATAAKRALGKPKAEFWEVLFKESVQNSWDARVGERIEFDAHIRSFSAREKKVLKEQIFRDSSGIANEELRTALGSHDSTVLILQDRLTRGLGGPTDASTALGSTIQSDFRNFIFDIGRDARRELGGGTYGFGKGILYSASAVSTCLVYSQFKEPDGELNSRFIVASVAEQHEELGRRFTGRQWWGRVDESDHSKRVHPVEGETARKLADEIGMNLPPGVTGTSIGILSPREPGAAAAVQSRTEIAKSLVEAIKKWAWPHMIETNGFCSIDFSVLEDGVGGIVSIDDDPEYGPFAEAYRAILHRKENPNADAPFTLSVNRTPIDEEKTRTGWLALKNIYVAGARPVMNNRVALMRGPRFIVDYKTVKPPEHGMPRVGVFVADSAAEIERTFAKSEPVTHDKWAREAGRAKYRPIAWTLDSIDELTGPKPSLDASNSQGEGAVGVSRISRLLGSSVIGLSGSGAERSHRSSSGSQGSGRMTKRAQVRIEGSPRFVSAEQDQIIVEFPVFVKAPDNIEFDVSGHFVRPKVRLKTEASDESPHEAEEVEIQGWSFDGQEAVDRKELLPLSEALTAANLWLRIAHKRDIAITVSVGVESGAVK